MSNPSFKSTLAMCASALALSVAVNVHADESSTQKTPPDRAAVEAAMKTCAESSGVTRGERPTKEQHEAMAACMKAAGFERPPGPPRGDHRGPPPGPPPEDAQPISTGGGASSVR